MSSHPHLQRHARAAPGTAGPAPGVAWRLLAFALPLWPWVLLSTLLGVAAIASSIGLLAASAWIIAEAALQPSIAILAVAIVGVRFFGIARGIFRYLERLATHEVTFRLLARFRVWFYARLEPLAPAVLAGYQGGDLLAAVTSDVETLENFYVRVVAPPLMAVVTAAGVALFFAAYDGRLAVALLAVLAAAGMGLPFLVQRLGRAPGRDLVASRAALAAALIDGVQGLADLLAYGQEGASLARVAEAGEALGTAQRHMASLRGLHTAAGSFLASLATLLIIVLATPLVRSARLSGVDLAVLALAAAAAFEAVLPLSLAAQYLAASLAAGRRLFAAVDRPGDGAAPQASAEIEAVPGSRAPAAAQPGVAPAGDASPAPGSLWGEPAATAAGGPAAAVLAVHGLRFRYAAGAPLALDGLSFALPAGATVALVGPSGAGKSTLVNLLLRFWDYEEGEILLAGRDLRACPAEEVRRRIGVVGQNTHLFNATVRDNLLLARPGATQAELEAAARAAEIHDFIAGLPDGYTTWIGERGVRLSGGERQRLAIARGLLKDAPILLLDEATANLDPLTERAVLAAIRRLMAGRTTLMITHRLAGVEAAGQVLVLRAGRVMAAGTHVELLAQNAMYRRLWEYQAQALALERLSPEAET